MSSIYSEEILNAWRKGYSDSVNDILEFIDNEIEKLEKQNENDIQVYNLKNLRYKIKLVFTELF